MSCGNTGLETQPSPDGPVDYACLGCVDCQPVKAHTWDKISTAASDKAQDWAERGFWRQG